MDNPEKIATLCTQEEEKQNIKHNTEHQQNVGHHAM